MFGHAFYNFFFCKCKLDGYGGLIADRHITLTYLNCINKKDNFRQSRNCQKNLKEHILMIILFMKNEFGCKINIQT